MRHNTLTSDDLYQIILGHFTTKTKFQFQSRNFRKMAEFWLFDIVFEKLVVVL